jgi:hypothetical protein
LAGIFIRILELVLHSGNILPVRIAIYNAWSLVSSSLVVQQNSFLLIMCVTHCSFWINFLSTFESGTHRVPGSERYTKDILGLQVCKNVGWVSLSFICNTHTGHHFLSYSQVTNPLMSSTSLSLSCKCIMYAVLNTFASENTFVWTWFFEAGMIQCISWVPESIGVSWTSL